MRTKNRRRRETSGAHARSNDFLNVLALLGSQALRVIGLALYLFRPSWTMAIGDAWAASAARASPVLWVELTPASQPD